MKNWSTKSKSKDFWVFDLAWPGWWQCCCRCLTGWMCTGRVVGQSSCLSLRWSTVTTHQYKARGTRTCTLIHVQPPPASPVLSCLSLATCSHQPVTHSYNSHHLVNNNQLHSDLVNFREEFRYQSTWQSWFRRSLLWWPLLERLVVPSWTLSGDTPR